MYFVFQKTAIVYPSIDFARPCNPCRDLRVKVESTSTAGSFELLFMAESLDDVKDFIDGESGETFVIKGDVVNTGQHGQPAYLPS